MTLGLTTGWALKDQLARRKVTFFAGVTYLEIDDGAFHYEQAGKRHKLEVDTVVLCVGQESDRSLYDELAALKIPARLIGGARSAAKLDALRAIEEGMRTAIEL